MIVKAIGPVYDVKGPRFYNLCMCRFRVFNCGYKMCMPEISPVPSRVGGLWICDECLEWVEKNDAYSRYDREE